ncbi:GNAT family N-acetyltransferase [Lactobacillus sp. ESL0681]|uniref:GNAT family N-acetyltransferase n=1 Tax=Lactobacillus sp. ESL0681 TaxID=2983211 RepID=UPI0023F8DFEB|nr:GNAT family N-acetyltransferase [Lactobacillus sp. ESL0681]WEV39921.1 GNAT family N-acetyltransferase [Lactobacillus sp. ESL0681]
MIEFIKAKDTDLRFIVEVYNQNIASKSVTADLSPVTVAQRQDWFAARDAQHPIWIIQVDKHKAGWLSLTPFYRRAAYHATVEISVYIDRDWQHHGLGTRALQFVTEQVKKLEIHTILAYIFTNNLPSLALFKAAGYQVYGHLPRVADMGEQVLDVDILGKQF